LLGGTNHVIGKRFRGRTVGAGVALEFVEADPGNGPKL
jgi:hypothetical protein